MSTNGSSQRWCAVTGAQPRWTGTPAASRDEATPRPRPAPAGPPPASVVSGSSAADAARPGTRGSLPSASAITVAAPEADLRLVAAAILPQPVVVPPVGPAGQPA